MAEKCRKNKKGKEIIISMGSKKILIINGPNLNLLGTREPSIYGKCTLEEINQKLINEGEELGLTLECIQSNSEGEIIEVIQRAIHNNTKGIIINPAAYTHTSIGIRDALAMLNIPKVEVHLSNIFAREEFRQKSLISAVVTGTISGFGTYGYNMALRFLAERLR